MTHSIKKLFHIAAPQEKVFKAINSVEGLKQWWTTETTGTSEVGAVLKFRFGGANGPDMKVTKLEPNSKVQWECVTGPDEWIGNAITFTLDENEGKTRVRFDHGGWKENGDFYAICCFSWGRYLESLRQLCQTGKGEGYGTAGYRT